MQIDHDRSEERRATDLPGDASRGKGSEYRFVSVLSFWYGVGLWVEPRLMSDSTRSAGVLGASAFFHIEGILEVGEAFTEPKIKYISWYDGHHRSTNLEV